MIAENISQPRGLLLIGLKVLVITIFEIFKELLKIFVPSKKECLRNQLALVSGGSNGLGKALCTRLAAEKCDLAIVDIDIENAQKVALDIEEKFKVQCRAYQCDIADILAVEKLKNTIENEMREVDILVNNAGLIYIANFYKSDVKDIQRVVDVNFTSQLLIVRTFLPTMIKRKHGKIVATCSIAGMNSLPFGACYSATKYGVDGFMNALYDELCILQLHDKIKLTTIYPDFTHTQKALVDQVKEIGLIYDMLTPERVANEAVEGIMSGKRRVLVSDMKLLHILVNKLPDKARIYGKKAAANFNTFMKE